MAPLTLRRLFRVMLMRPTSPGMRWRAVKCSASPRALSVIEAQIGAGEDGAWLAGLAFRPGHGGWWRRTVDQAAKVELLPRLAERLGGALVNLHVRDLESIAVEENLRDGEAR